MSDATPTLRVLVIDDEPFQLKLLSRQLGNLGLTGVTTCQHAREALALLQAEPGAYALVCCDLQMPEMDGVEFIRHLGGIGFSGSLALISGEESRIVQTAERLAQAHGIRVVGALLKPVAPERLRDMIAAARSAPEPAPREPRPSYSPDELGDAIAHGELVNFYQPKVELATGRVVGVEALVRWRHRRDGLVYPDQFIAVAEQHGLIEDLTRAVLAGPGGALRQARLWQDAGHPLNVAVNVSMDNLTDHAFPGFVAAQVALVGIPPSRLTLEVTESRVMRDPLVTLDILTRMRLKRIGLSIDDFGTGHSSLTQLRDVPFDELKVDRSFVHGASCHGQQRAIVQASVDMARQLGLKSVAEGVEDGEDWHFMRASGCDLAQGYFIARPMPAADLLEWCEQWEARLGGLLG